MRNNNSDSLNNAFNGSGNGKDKKISGQERKTFQAFYSQPKTMLMVSVETGIERANICRYVATLRKQGRIFLVRNGICSISKHNAGYLTTNVEFLKPESHE